MTRWKTAPAVAERVDGIDWQEAAAALDKQGYATLPALLDSEECRALAALYG